MPIPPSIDIVRDRNEMFTLQELWDRMGQPMPFNVWWLNPDDDWVTLQFNSRESRDYTDTIYWWVAVSDQEAACDPQHSGYARQRRYYPIEALKNQPGTCKCNYRQVILVTGCRCGRGK